MKPEQKAKPEKKFKKVKVVKKKGNGSFIIGIVAVVLLAAIAYAVLSGDKTEKTEDIKLPSYAYTNPLTLKAYKYATEHPEILEQIPCYCGCGQHGTATSDNKPHRFVRDCFINDKWEYDDHASFCDVCIGIAVTTQDEIAKGKTLKEVRAAIDAKYGPTYSAGKTNTPPVRDDYVPILKAKLSSLPKATAAAQTTPSIDLSSLSLPDNFKSLSDGLKLVPQGITWAYFTNLKQGVGIEQNFMPDANFYGLSIIGMLNSEYSENSWVELHDVGKTNANVKSNGGQNVDNILFTRPYVFSTKDRTNSVLAIFNNPENANAYNSFKSLLEKVNDENAGFAKINIRSPSFADASYFGLVRSGNDVAGEIGFIIKANATLPLTKYNDLKNSSLERGFKAYEVKKENNTLIIRMTSNLNNVISEATQNYEIEI